MLHPIITLADVIAADKTHLEMRCTCVVKWIPIGHLPRAVRDADDDEVLCIVTIRADRRITTWVSDRIETAEQWAWLYGQVAGATHQLVEMQGDMRPWEET